MEAAPPLTALIAGSVIGGCRLTREIGSGAFGAVYEARQLSLDRRVALKVLKSTSSAHDEAAQARLIREARIAARWSHPSIVQVYDVGLDQGIVFMVMEFVEGTTLRELLRKSPRLSQAWLHRIGLQVASGLALAHGEGLAHRDIKPANILLTPHDALKIADFGCAEFVQGEAQRQGGFEGTPSFAAPEVIQGQVGDGKGDLYALGLILYTGAAGAYPFAVKSVEELLRAHVETPLAPLLQARADLPRRFTRLIDRLCAKSPAERPTSSELVRALTENSQWGLGVVEPSAATCVLAATTKLETAPPPATQAPPVTQTPPVTQGIEPQGEAQAATPRRQASLMDASLRRVASGETPREGSQSSEPPQGDVAHASSSQQPEKKASPKALELCVQARFSLLSRKWKQAEETYRAALEIDPRHGPAWLGLARALTEQSRTDDAVSVLGLALRSGSIAFDQIRDLPHFRSLRGRADFCALESGISR